MRIRRALLKTNTGLSGGDLRAFQEWTWRVPWLTKRIVVQVIEKTGISFTDINATDCGIAMEIALYGSYRRREILGMAWVGRAVYDFLPI
jgi:hypothetical protein